MLNSPPHTPPWGGVPGGWQGLHPVVGISTCWQTVNKCQDNKHVQESMIRLDTSSPELSFCITMRKLYTTQISMKSENQYCKYCKFYFYWRISISVNIFQLEVFDFGVSCSSVLQTRQINISITNYYFFLSGICLQTNKRFHYNIRGERKGELHQVKTGFLLLIFFSVAILSKGSTPGIDMRTKNFFGLWSKPKSH